MFKSFKIILFYFLIIIFLFCKKEPKEPPWWWVPGAIAEEPCWTPDGSKIAYRRNNQIWLVDTFGNTWNMFEGSSMKGFFPHFSPDGKWIVFESGYQIYKARVREDWRIDFSSLTKLTHLGKNFHPKWSPKGDLIAYDSNVENDRIVSFYGVTIMSTDGSYKKRIIESRLGEARAPDWSPDGEKIAFVGGFDTPYPQIAIISLSDLKIKRLTSDPTRKYSPSWSPDGRFIAFERDTSEKYFGEKVYGIFYIYLLDTATLSLTRITQGYRPAFSPDGKKIAYVGFVGTRDWKTEYKTLFIIDLETKKRKQLVFK